MDALLPSFSSLRDRIICVTVWRPITLQRVEPEEALGASLQMDIEPATYRFRLVDFKDGRKEARWALLMSDETFGIPLKNLRVLDMITESVEVKDEEGNLFFS